MADFVRSRNYRMVAEIARSIACDADRCNAKDTSHRNIKPVVGIRICVCRQGICHPKEVAVADSRIRVGSVLFSVPVPVVRIYALVDCLDIVVAKPPFG